MSGVKPDPHFSSIASLWVGLYARHSLPLKNSTRHPFSLPGPDRAGPSREGRPPCRPHIFGLRLPLRIPPRLLQTCSVGSRLNHDKRFSEFFAPGLDVSAHRTTSPPFRQRDSRIRCLDLARRTRPRAARQWRDARR